MRNHTFRKGMTCFKYSSDLLSRARDLFPLLRISSFAAIEQKTIPHLVVGGGFSSQSSFLTFGKARWIFVVPKEIVYVAIFVLVGGHSYLHWTTAAKFHMSI